MEDSFLTTKNVILNNPGSRFNGLYYSNKNSSVDIVECTFGWQNIISLPSLTFGSSNQVNLPIDQFIGEIILHLRLPNITATAPNGQQLVRGWGYAMLSSISYSLGNSNTTQITLQGDSILQAVMAQCTDPLKRDEILKLAGQELRTPLVAPVGGDVPFNDAYVILPFPWSTACSKLAIDSTMLSSNVNIKIDFKQNASAIYGGADTRPSAFTVAEIMLRQGKLSNQALSLSNIMHKPREGPPLAYNYPFTHTQYFISPTFEGKKISDAYQGCQVDLNGFSNSDLIGISFYVIKVTDKNPVGNAPPNPFNADDISNVLVTFNGSTLFNFPYQSYRLTNMLGEQSASYYPYSVINSTGTQSTPKNCYMVMLDFSQDRGICFMEHFYNVFRLPNQILRVNFNTSTDDDYVMIATFYYNAIAQFAMGTSSIFID